MKQAIIFFFAVLCFTIIKSQNVGMGTATPQTKLHVYSTNAQVGVRVETNSLSDDANFELKTNGGLYDYLELRKYPSLASGSLAGIPMNDLSLIRTGANANGGLMFGTSGNHSIYFLSNNLERMRLTGEGSLGIGITNPDASALVDIQSTSKGILIPKMLQSQRPLNPATGLLIYQTDNNPGFYYNANTPISAAWKKINEPVGYPTLSGNKVRYTTYGLNEFIVPNGVHRVFFEMAAAGGGAGGNYTGGTPKGGGGGGGGGYGKGYITVSPGEVLWIIIGTPGVNGTSNATSPTAGIIAENCIITSGETTLVTTTGGQGGVAATAGAQGNGGSGGSMTYNSSRVVLTTRPEVSNVGGNGLPNSSFAGVAGFVYSLGEYNYLDHDQVIAGSTTLVSFGIPKPHYGKGGGPFAQPIEGYVVLFW